MSQDLQSRYRAWRLNPSKDLVLTRLLATRFSGPVRDYFRRLDAAGLRVTTYDAANARLIDRLVANGGNFWPDSGAFCAMAGYSFPTAGTLIPLKDGHDAGTLNAFVSGDWNAVTGLKGDGDEKYVDSNRSNLISINDNAFGAFLDSYQSNNIAHLIMGARGVESTGSDQIIGNFGNTAGQNRMISKGIGFNPTPSSVGGYFGVSRNTDTNFTARSDRTNTTGPTTVSQTPVGSNFFVFARSEDTTPNVFTDARIMLYHIGPNLNGTGELAELDAILTDWQTHLANA